MNSRKPSQSQIAALALRVEVLEAELRTCTTYAQRKCVSESLEAATKRLNEVRFCLDG